MSYEVMNECCCIQMSFVGVDQPPPPLFFFKTSLFLQIKDIPTIHRSIGQTKVLNNSFNQFVYNFYPQSIGEMETWYNAFKFFLINFIKTGCQL